VTVWLAVQVVDVPGSSVVCGRETPPTFRVRHRNPGDGHIAGVGLAASERSTISPPAAHL
jgi:hypothetical protein